MEIVTLDGPVQVGIAVLILTLPGTALYLLVRQLFKRESPRALRQAPLVGIGLSIAFWPLLLLYTSLLGIPFGTLLTWPIILVSSIYIAWRMIAIGQDELAEEARPYVIGLALLTLIALICRMGDIAGLTVPMFGDSLHHTMITTMILDQQRLPDGWLPYVPVDTFTYHFGFHTLSAVLAQLAGIDAAHAVLLMGQVLIALSLPAAYYLNMRLFNSRLAGLAAALITGFISIMPAFYVNWGRYTQLSGHLLLVIALGVVIGIKDQRSEIRDQESNQDEGHVSRITHQDQSAIRNPQFAIVVSGLCVAGLVLVHYRVLIFFGLFLLALAIWYLVSMWGRWRVLGRTLGWIAAATVGGFVLTLPWIIRLIVDYVPSLAGRLSTVTPEYLSAYNDPNTIRVFVGTALPILGILGIVMAIAGIEGKRTLDDRRQSTSNHKPTTDNRQLTTERNGLALVVALWILLLIGSLWVVPGAIGGYTIAITLYIPLAALGGFGIERVIRLALRWVRLGEWEHWLAAAAIVLAAGVAMAVTGSGHLGDPGRYAYVQEADRAAFAWIRSNTPPFSKFLISSEFSYAGRGLTATDAGMWIPLLAGGGRTVSIPASITGNEHSIDPEFFANTRKLAAYTQPIGKPGEVGDSLQVNLVERGIIPHTRSITDAETLALMEKLECKYVYVGAQQGLSKTVLDVDAMKKDTTHFTIRYDQNGVYLFEITP